MTNPTLDPDETSAMAVFEPDVRASRRARHWLSRVVGDLVAPSMLDDAQLVLSELVTNAVRHGAGDVVTRATISTAGQLALSATDCGAIGRAPRDAPEPDRARVGGSGLVIVERLSAAWGVASFPGGKTIWAVLDPHPGDRPPT